LHALGSEIMGRDIPVTYVPFRNAHFLAVSVSWAEVLGAEKIFIGAVEPDSSGYPDCRPEFLDAFQRVIVTGTRSGVEHGERISVIGEPAPASNRFQNGSFWAILDSAS
jgi:7-cyano-7-deazaguanine synthase in queuosine biosynthesis